MRSSLNLASRPFGNEVLPWLGVGALALLTLGLSLWHAWVLAELAGGRGSAEAAEVRLMQQELEALRVEERELHGPAPEAEDIRRWTQLAALVEHRAFSFTLLLSRLEAVMPWDVRLVEISPSGQQHAPELGLAAVARSTRSGLNLIELLEQRPEFSDVRPQTLTEVGELVRMRYELRYDPVAAAAAAEGRPADADAEGQAMPRADPGGGA